MNRSLVETSVPLTLLLTINDLLFAAVLIITFSLLTYILLQNWNNPIARALGVLLSGIVVVFGGDVLIGQAQQASTVQVLLRAQWLGIVFVPAGYVHLADALLTYSGQPDRRRVWAVVTAYIISLALFGLAFGTNLLLQDHTAHGPFVQFAPGPLFSLFVIYFVLACGTALAAVLHVRRSALTPLLRRRLTYLSLATPGPALAVFPYLTLIDPALPINEMQVLIVSMIGSILIGALTMLMVYSIAFQGLPLPDRLIRQDFVRWVLYGPFVGISIVLFIRGVPVLARWLGLPTETLLIFGVMIMTVLMPIFINRVKPYLDALIYTQDHAEIDYLRALPRNTFTSADLRSLLENTLVAICGALHVETGFVAAPDEDGNYTIKTIVGARRTVRRFVTDHPLSEVIPRLMALPSRPASAALPPEAFVRANGIVLLPLHAPTGEFLGALGVEYPRDDMADVERRLIGVLAHQMELALTTVQMQQRLFGALRGMGPEMRSLQELNTRLEQATPASLQSLESDVVSLPEFSQLVKDALTHYWGGPKLSDSPLLSLRSVRRLTDEQGGSQTRALQAVLRQAIENLRPDPQLDPSAQEWVLYNILEMRFLQGKRIRDTANRLAMSESDLYRKQRIAIEEVARQLTLMEESEGVHTRNGKGEPVSQ